MKACALCAACCVLVTVLWRPVSAQSLAGTYGKECSDDTACSGAAPVCAVFFEDFSARVSPCVTCHCVMFVKNIKQENKAKIGSSLARARAPSTKQMSANKGTRTPAKTNHLTTF